MEGYAYYNGKIGLCDEITIPLTDRLIYFGDGVYDVIAGHHKRLFLEDEHIERFFSNMEFLRIQPPGEKGEIKEIIHKLTKRSGYESYLVYVSASRNAPQRMHSFLCSDRTNLLIIIREFEMATSGALDLTVTEDNRYKFCNIKTTNLLPSVLASTLAEKKGCDEAVFVRDGIVTECSHSNIFIAKGDNLITHPATNLILSGIIRGFVIKNAAELGAEVIEKEFSIEDLYNADEVLVTSTTKLICEARTVDRIAVGGKNPSLVQRLKTYILNSYNEI